MFKLFSSIAVFLIGVLMACYAYSSSVATCSLDMSLSIFQCLQKLSIVIGIFSFAVMLVGIILTVNNYKELAKHCRK